MAPFQDPDTSDRRFRGDDVSIGVVSIGVVGISDVSIGVVSIDDVSIGE